MLGHTHRAPMLPSCFRWRHNPAAEQNASFLTVGRGSCLVTIALNWMGVIGASAPQVNLLTHHINFLRLKLNILTGDLYLACNTFPGVWKYASCKDT